MQPNDANSSNRSPGERSKLSSRERDLQQLDRRSHGGTQNGSTQSDRARHLSEQDDADAGSRPQSG